MEQFSVSIKGVLKLNNKFLLRRNERGEFELLGGRLEKSDVLLEQRLKTEFLEESGIKVKVLEAREPWLYQVGTGRVVIVPFVCSCLNIPDKLEDGDGGTLHWINSDQINNLFMPQG
ncbi:MAG: NUDIX hydrolase, partial [Synergistaceae bacterium]|nr:NUDIX hydrolase [Synergistaceae bacterium]